MRTGEPAATMRAADVYRATALMTLGTALSRATGLLRVSAMTYALGVAGTRLADTYNLANTPPNILYELTLGGIFTAVFVPVLVELRGRAGDEESALISTSLVALAAISAAAAAAAPWIVRIYTFRVPDPQARAEQAALATGLLRLFAPQIFFYGLAAVAEALLNTRRRFGPPKFTPILNNLVVAGTFFAYASAVGRRDLRLPAGAVTLLGLGTTAGVAVQALALLPFLRGEGLRFRPKLASPAVRRVIRLSGWVIAYVLTNQVAYWLVLALANRRPGGVTAYQVAFMFFQLPHGLFAVSLLSALVPDLSEAASAGDRDRYREAFWTGLRGMAFLLVPASLGYAVLAEPITRLLLAHGAAGVQDAALVASVLRAFAAGLVFFSAFQLATRCFFATQDTRTPMLINLAASAVNVAAAVALYPPLGVQGLAAAHAASYAVGSALLLAALGRRVGGLRPRAHLAPLARIGVAAAAMGLGVWTVVKAVGGPDAATIAAAVPAGALLYTALARALRLPERRLLLAALRREVAEPQAADPS